jgi:hypothetical protein
LYEQVIFKDSCSQVVHTILHLSHSELVSESILQSNKEKILRQAQNDERRSGKGEKMLKRACPDLVSGFSMTLAARPAWFWRPWRDGHSV